MRAHFRDWPWDARHLTHIQDTLDRFTAGEITKVMIFMPPRHMKSESVTVRYTAWRLERDPALPVILAAYNQNLANLFSRKVRRIVRARIPLSEERQAVEGWDTIVGGGLRAVGVGSGITGQGGRLIVIDDPVKSREEADSPAYRERVWEWYTDDLYTRRELGAQMILIMTRWHRDDLAGRILASEDGPNWDVLSLPAINDAGEALWPERFPLAELASIRASTSERTWHALYQQQPTAEGGVMFERDWWDGQNRFNPAAPPACAARVLSWDTAEETNDTAAYTACTVGEIGADRRLRIREVWRGRLTFPELCVAIVQRAERWNQDGRLHEVVVENKSSGKGAIQTVRATAPAWLRNRIVAWEPRVSKTQRASQAAVWCRNGMVLLPEPGFVGEAPSPNLDWLLPFEQELYTFPHSAFADQTDSFSQLVLYLEPWIKAGYR